MRRNRNNSTVSVANLEPYSCHEPVAKKKVKRLDTRCDLYVHSKRHRLTDPDGCSCKGVIDGLVIGGLLADDSAKEIREIRFSQEKVPKTEAEQTVITIRKLKKGE